MKSKNFLKEIQGISNITKISLSNFPTLTPVSVEAKLKDNYKIIAKILSKIRYYESLRMIFKEKHEKLIAEQYDEFEQRNKWQWEMMFNKNPELSKLSIQIETLDKTIKYLDSMAWALKEVNNSIISLTKIGND